MHSFHCLLLAGTPTTAQNLLTMIRFTAFLFLYFAYFPASFCQVVINELDSDQVGTDALEFVELYNTSGSSVSLTGYSLVFFNGSNDQSYLTIALSGSIPANGYIIIGNSGVTGVDFTFGGDILQNGQDAVALYSSGSFPNGSSPTTTNLVDALVYDTNDADDPGLLSGLGQSTQYNESETGSSATVSISRFPNGTGGFAITNPTPDATNSTPLPITLTLFTGEIKCKSTLLSFSTATELNNSHFVIERSADARVFAEIGQVRGAGTTRIDRKSVV